MLPTLNLNIENTIYKDPEDGVIVYKYAPFQNLKTDLTNNENNLSALRISSQKAKLDINSKVDLLTESSYDGSVNLIINDRKNSIKLINSRFYLDSAYTYKIADRKGNVDTNIYNENEFDNSSSFVKIVDSIVSLDFLGIEDGGRMPVGNYNFFFKLSDADGNESDFISESGNIVCHIGSVNTPTSIRGGQVNENSGKVIKLKLNNLDLSYTYINIYYTRKTGSGDNEILETYKIVDKFKISNFDTTISITGYEQHLLISEDEINISYANFDSVKSLESCQNMIFAGNISKDYEIYKTLEKYSLLITPSLNFTEDIGNLDHLYKSNYSNNGYEYFNSKNIYYRVGYWDEEIYRFGIVYILNNYQLSPVFNIRGCKLLEDNTVFNQYNIDDLIEIGEDYSIIKDGISSNENSKGVFKINTSFNVFSGTNNIRPIGLKFNFGGDVLTGNNILPGLKDITKGFFIVRQKRIPTILTQGLSIATSTLSKTPLIYGNGSGTKGYFSESFLSKGNNNNPVLGRSMFKVSNETTVKNNALICPDASLNSENYGSIFNSSEFVLKKSKTTTRSDGFLDTSLSGNKYLFYLGNITTSEDTSSFFKTPITLVTPGIELISNGDDLFSSKAGDRITPWTNLDPVYGNIEDLKQIENSYTESELTKSTTRLRGEFNTYLGVGSNLDRHQLYNIFQKDYDFTNNWNNYFKVRYNDSSPYFAVSDRTSWDNITSETIGVYRGDCYINTYTHRVNWNFIDPDLPTNKSVIDKWNWYKNFRIKQVKIKTGSDFVVEDTSDSYTGEGHYIYYKKMLDTFTLSSDDLNKAKVVLSDGKNFDKYSKEYGIFGATKISRPDVNAIPLGHWITFKVCSNENLAMRDIDFTRSQEESLHNLKRSFYPLQEANPNFILPESNIINKGISNTLSNKYYFEIPDVPFIKTSFTNRIYYSNVFQENAFKNNNRIFLSQNYQDYSNEYGNLVKLIEWFGNLIAVMQHGILMIPVNERALMNNVSGQNVYVNTEKVLPNNPVIISDSFGSLWSESIIKTSRYIYGIDPVAKKIWRTNGKNFELISDLKIQKFLNDNLNISQADVFSTNMSNSIKIHYNAFKHDVMFVINNSKNRWSLCWNEMLNKWITKYSWFPNFSENIDNNFYTFANTSIHSSADNYLYKHGFSGLEDEVLNIKPTYWYDEQHPFEFEFVVIGQQGIQKIFNNLKIISNSTSPESFYYEIIGEGFSWNELKHDFYNYTLDQQFLDYLIANPSVKKIPYIKYQENFIRDRSLESLVRDITIKDNSKTKEKLINFYHKAQDIKKVGRLKGNMQYVEDSWDIQIQPINFKYAYLNSSNDLVFSKSTEMKIRDKYIKIRIRYDGSKYALIQAIQSIFTLSYS